MNDEMYSWDVAVPGRGWEYHYAVRDSFIDCGFSIRPVYSIRTGAVLSSRFTVDHTSAGAVTYWELRCGLIRFPEVTVRETVV
jgi:hypothetical protein